MCLPELADVLRKLLKLISLLDAKKAPVDDLGRCSLIELEPRILRIAASKCSTVNALERIDLAGRVSKGFRTRSQRRHASPARSTAMSNTRITQQHDTDFPEFRIDVQFIEGKTGEELQRNLASTVRSLLRWASIEIDDSKARSREAA